MKTKNNNATNAAQTAQPNPTRNTSAVTDTPKSPAVPLVPLNFFRKSVRADDHIAKLPPEDQAQIIYWFATGQTYRKIIELAAQPRPEGLNLRLSLASLNRFYHKHNLAEQIADAAELVADLSPDGDANPERAFEILAQTHALHTMASPDLNHAAFQHISRYLLRQEDQRIRQRALDLKEKRLAFDMEHKHYDIVKRTIEKLPEINELVRNESLTPEQKIREHSVRMFGLETVEMIEQANEKWDREHPNNHTSPSYDPKHFLPPLTPEERAKVAAEFFAPEDESDDTMPD